MSYEEKYGEEILGDREQELEQEKIDKEERLENLEECIKRISGLLKSATNLEDLISEIEYEIKCLD